MSENDTLMAYLVPKLTAQVENAATDALGYILNRSAASREALDKLLQDGGFSVPPIVRVETQVTYEDGSRPDMAGYDEADVKRLLVESKFWATLLAGQASGYLGQFDHSEPAVLLFLAPEVRIETLWTEIARQIEEDKSGTRLTSVETSRGCRSSLVEGTEKRVMLVSWRRLLESMATLAGDATVREDIRQLLGLAQAQDDEAFLPMHSEELSPDYARRVIGYNRLADDVVDSRGVREGWMSVSGLRATPQRYGYGRYFHFVGVAGDFWFGVNHDMWARGGDTPLWLHVVHNRHQPSMIEIGRKLNVRVQGRWVPIRPKIGVEYSEVLDDVVSKIKQIGRILGANLPVK